MTQDFFLLDPERMRLIDPVCDAFEARWRAGDRPQIDDYLQSTPADVRPHLVEELIRIELEWRCRRGETPAGAEYAGRFPARPADLDAWLSEALGAALTHARAATGDTSVSDSPTQAQPAPPSTGAPVAGGSGAAPPQVLGPYELLEELGAGGMGKVYKARHQRLGKIVALKVLQAGAAGSLDAVRRFQREAQAQGGLDHDNVVEAHDAGEQYGVLYLAMRLIDGVDLSRLVREHGPLAIHEVCDVGKQIARGLKHLREKGVVHRDLKPSNVIRAANGQVKIVDFGLARLRPEAAGDEALTRTGQIFGTPDFMAPEQACRPLEADYRADLYALGATLYYLLTRQAPFAHRTGLEAKLRAHLSETAADVRDARPDVPGPLAELIAQLLAKDPKDRPPGPDEVEASLERISSASTASFRGLGMPERARRRRLPIAIAVAVVLGLACAVVVILWSQFGRQDPDRPAGKDAVSGPSKVGPGGGVVYAGKVDVLIERVIKGAPRLVRMNEPGALPLRTTDKFRIEGEIDPPAYLYVVWVDPERDVTPVYPWDPRVGWGTRPAEEQPVKKISLPTNPGNRYTAPKARPGVATMVLLARPTPLEAADDVVKGWFESLPGLPLPAGGEGAAVWFDDFVEVRDPLRLRTFGEVGSDDAFARWQGELQKALGGRFAFQTAVSFARTGME